MQLCGSLSILWHCLSLGLEWKLTFSSPVATAEFSKFADILSAHSRGPFHPLTFCRTHLATALHSSTLAWKIPWTEEPGRLQSMGSLKVGHNWAISLSLFTFMHWRRKWQPAPVFLPGESQGRGGAWWAAAYGVTQSRTRLKWLSSRSSSRTHMERCYYTAFTTTSPKILEKVFLRKGWKCTFKNNWVCLTFYIISIHHLYITILLMSPVLYLTSWFGYI